MRGNMREEVKAIIQDQKSGSRVRNLLILVCMTLMLTGCNSKVSGDENVSVEQAVKTEEEQSTEEAQATEEAAVTEEVTVQETTPEKSVEIVVDFSSEEENDEEEQKETGTNEGSRVVVWGDSLTEGTGGDGVTYPNVLEKLAGCEVKNYGVYAEVTTCIAGRQGGMPENVHPVTIPAQVADVDVQIENGDGGWDMLLVFGDAGINPCTIAGVEGKLWIDSVTGQRKFTRSQAGEEVVLTERTPIKTFAMRDKRPDDILVIFTGSNDDPTPKTVKNIIAVQRDMIAYAGVDRYVIIGLTCKRKMPMTAEVNEVLAKEYGEHFLDVRKDLLEHGLQDSGIEPTAEDQADIAGGYIPRSLLSDDIHGNAAFYTVIGEALYQKMQEMNYLK